jgi:hypothetical protein
MGQWAVTGTVPVFTVPPGPCSVTMYVSAGTAYTGLSASVSATNGMSVATTPVTFQCFPSSAGQQLYATTGNTTTTVAIHYIVSSAR